MTSAAEVNTTQNTGRRRGVAGLGVIGLGLAAMLCAFASSASAQVYRLEPIDLPPGTTRGEAWSVNSAGTVAGRAWSPALGGYVGFVRVFDSPAQVTELMGPDEQHGLFSVNDAGLAVGTRAGSIGDRAVVFEAGELRDITPPGLQVLAAQAPARAWSVNNAGVIAGAMTTACGAGRFGLVGGQWSPGGVEASLVLAGGGRTALGCAAAELLSINPQGIAAGYSTVNVGTLLSPVFEPRPFLVNFAGASITPLMTFTSPTERGIARSVSASGDACGTAQDLSDQGREYPVAWVDGTIVRLASLSGGYEAGSTALGIGGTLGQDVVGRSGDEATGRAVLWRSAGPPVDLQAALQPAQPAWPAGWKLVTARAISASGIIVGEGLAPGDLSGNMKPFLLVPCNPVVVQAPMARTVCPNETLVLSVVSVAAGTQTYRWRRNGVFLADGATPSGALVVGSQTRAMLIAGFRASDAGSFDVVITSECGQAASAAAELRYCPFDLSCDGFVTDSDFVPFVESYLLLLCDDPAMPTGCPADFNADQQVDDADFLLFVEAYLQFFCP